MQDHLNDYKNSKKLKPENGGSQSHLTNEQASQLIGHLEAITYTKVEHICAHVEQVFNVHFTVSSMTKWLKRNDFSYKKPKGTPAKAAPEQQTEFIEKCEALLNTISEDEPIEFADAVHPTMATKITYGWIRKGRSN